MDLSQLNYLAVFVSALTSFLIGGLWYSPVMFSNAWMKENGFKEEDLKDANIAKIFGTSFVLALIIAFNLAAFIGSNSDLSFGLFAGFAAGFGWVAMSLGITYLFERKSFKLFLINAGYHIVTYTIMGGILAVWK
ncbi:MAG: hypothetical protein CMF23_14590 [Ignavibacteriae bacterium]|nr:hypothetical protein [Ignavibacteriota bacterium]|tara:strand:+ start:135 stop:539 length:405 start_codon:yes stop_codon:yes gene_type:complete